MVRLNTTRPVALTIAGSDSSGGAGIQADLKAFSLCGVYGASVITCITAQNTAGIQLIEPMKLEIIAAQLDSVLSDIKPTVIKTGMLYSAEIINLVVEKLKDYQELHNMNQLDSENKNCPLVVDPVMLATTGDKLTKNYEDNDEFNKFLIALKKSLFPMATIITPNLNEAEVLLGAKLQTEEDRKHGCKELLKLGPKYVLLKGGHVPEDEENSESSAEAVDMLYDGDFKTFKATRYPKDVHGTGCSFASTITGFLAKGYEVQKAIEQAKEMVSIGIRDSLSVGTGIDVVYMKSSIQSNDEVDKILNQVTQAAFELTTLLKPYFVPEVGINIGYARSDVKTSQDICALTGRIVRVGQGVGVLGQAEFGASKHIARIILTANNFDKSFRSAMNIKYRPEIIEVCRDLGFDIGSFSRENEPKGISSMEWGTKTVIETLGRVPDIIFDTGGIGKEPMVRILGTQPMDVLNKVKQIIEKIG